VLLTCPRKHAGIRKLAASIVYAGGALATAYWIEIALWPEQPYYGNAWGLALLRVALVGSAILGAASLASLFKLQYGVALGLTAACLSWLYFAPFAASLPWGSPEWLLGWRGDGREQTVAILMLSVTTLHSLIEAWNLRRSRGGSR